MGRVDYGRCRRNALVESHSDKQGAAPTFKKHVYGLHPIVVSVANTSEILAVRLRNGNAGSNTVADHITVLGEAIAQIPARHRKKIIFRADGTGATKNLGLRRLPSYYLALNQAWCTAVAIAADLLSWLRLLPLDHHPKLTKATPDTLRRTLLHIPARLIHHSRRRLIRLPADHPHAGDLTHA